MWLLERRWRNERANTSLSLTLMLSVCLFVRTGLPREAYVFENVHINSQMCKQLTTDEILGD